MITSMLPASAAAAPFATMLSASAHAALPVDIFQLPNRAGPITEIDQDMSAEEFRARGFAVGFGKPLLIHEAAMMQPAFTRWATDAKMVHRHGDAEVDRVEYAKKESRTADEKVMLLHEWLQIYNATDAYLVAGNDASLGKDLALPSMLACADQIPYLASYNVWMSSGGTKSVVHNDPMDNLFCQLDGTKHFALWDVVNKTTMESSTCGWYTADEDDDDEPAYGSWAKINVDAIDSDMTPGFFELPWWKVTVQKGDCLFIPTGWYHEVQAGEGRNIAFNMWWYRNEKAANATCETPSPGKAVAAADCSWRYEPAMRRNAVPEELGEERIGVCSDFGNREKVPHAESLASELATADAGTVRREMKKALSKQLAEGKKDAGHDGKTSHREIVELALQRLRGRAKNRGRSELGRGSREDEPELPPKKTAMVREADEL